MPRRSGGAKYAVSGRMRKARRRGARETASKPVSAVPVETVARPAIAYAKVARPSPERAIRTTDYQYVFTDLRNIALIGGAMILLLIVLSFFVR